MKIMVFDVPAESGGALSILNTFYNEYKKDINNNYIFVISKPNIQETNNIMVLRFPWIKKSWFHRLYFDNFIAPKLVKKFRPDKILSLQNIIVPQTRVPQSLFVHNALPLADYRFSIFEDKLLWVYQNIMSRVIFRSIKKSNNVIVQTKWMKKKCIEKLSVDASKIEVLEPLIDIEIKKRFINNKVSFSTFFYPASGVTFKNHKVIIDACIQLKNKAIDNYRVIFTLNGNENKHVSILYKKVNELELPVEFIGSLTQKEVFDYYSKSILLFPSYIETVGLPLIEAKMHNTPILVSDCSYSREVLEEYSYVKYFEPFNSDKLFELMKDAIIHKRVLKDG